MTEPLNRRQVRAMTMRCKPLPPSCLRTTRHGDHVLVGIDVPGYVRLTPVEAVQFAEALLCLAGDNQPPDPSET